MKSTTPCQLFVQAAVVFGICAGARAAEWYEAETAAGNPLATLTNIGLGYEYTHDSSSKEKFIPSANWTLGEKTGRHDWTLGIELPVWVTLPRDGPREEGFGDLKLRATHLWVEEQSSLIGSYLETEFDTANDDVMAVANQRTQMTFGSGFISNLGDGWAAGAALQYGWSLDAGTTNGWKSEWECRVGLRKKLLDQLSLTLLYKSTFDVAGGTVSSTTLEPSLALSFGIDNCFSLWLASELPLQGKTEDYTAKIGLKRQF
jgi:hypothetical protein